MLIAFRRVPSVCLKFHVINQSININIYIKIKKNRGLITYQIRPCGEIERYEKCYRLLNEIHCFTIILSNKRLEIDKVFVRERKIRI